MSKQPAEPTQSRAGSLPRASRPWSPQQQQPPPQSRLGAEEQQPRSEESFSQLQNPIYPQLAAPRAQPALPPPRSAPLPPLGGLQERPFRPPSVHSILNVIDTSPYPQQPCEPPSNAPVNAVAHQAQRDYDRERERDRDRIQLGQPPPFKGPPKRPYTADSTTDRNYVSSPTYDVHARGFGSGPSPRVPSAHHGAAPLRYDDRSSSNQPAMVIKPPSTPYSSYEHSQQSRHSHTSTQQHYQHSPMHQPPQWASTPAGPSANPPSLLRATGISTHSYDTYTARRAHSSASPRSSFRSSISPGPPTSSTNPHGRPPSSQHGTYQYLSLATSSGNISIPVDVQAASRSADEKRRRNAGASARFRARRKEKEQANGKEIEDLRDTIRQLGEDAEFYRRERDYLAAALWEGGGSGGPSGAQTPQQHQLQQQRQTIRERHFPRPPSPRQRRPIRPPPRPHSVRDDSPADTSSAYSPYAEVTGEHGTSGRHKRRRLLAEPAELMPSTISSSSAAQAAHRGLGLGLGLGPALGGGLAAGTRGYERQQGFAGPAVTYEQQQQQQQQYQQHQLQYQQRPENAGAVLPPPPPPLPLAPPPLPAAAGGQYR